MLTKFYLLFGGAVVAAYLAAAFMGWEVGSPQRQTLPAEYRTPGGYRSFHFWHSGYRGGK
ncbi:MAG TPA: hypothetical protein VER32_10980 [Pyrinomonadaceae bacterium]|nr:hypothetical protein [Pyrinomonadaceae bacterium]